MSDLPGEVAAFEAAIWGLYCPGEISLVRKDGKYIDGRVEKAWSLWKIARSL